MMIRIINYFINLQTLQKLGRPSQQQNVSQDSFQCKSEPEHSIHSSQCVFKAAVAMFAGLCSWVHALRHSKQVNNRFLFLLGLFLLRLFYYRFVYLFLEYYIFLLLFNICRSLIETSFFSRSFVNWTLRSVRLLQLWAPIPFHYYTNNPCCLLLTNF